MYITTYPPSFRYLSNVFAREALARRGPFDFAVADLQVLLPSRIEHRGFDQRAGRAVRVDLRGQVHPGGTTRVDEGQHLVHVIEGAASDVNDVEERARLLRGSDGLANGADAKGASVHKGRNTCSFRHPEHRGDLLLRGGGGIVDPEADA
jgi:hypothetical protein